ncbi:MAG: hypothetical protein U0T81_04160 [Saprospiraceae bacterium]
MPNNIIQKYFHSDENQIYPIPFVALCFLAGSTASIGQTSLDPELNAKVKAALKENGQTIQFYGKQRTDPTIQIMSLLFRQ